MYWSFFFIFLVHSVNMTKRVEINGNSVNSET